MAPFLQALGLAHLSGALGYTVTRTWRAPPLRRPHARSCTRGGHPCSPALAMTTTEAAAAGGDCLTPLRDAALLAVTPKEMDTANWVRERERTTPHPDATRHREPTTTRLDHPRHPPTHPPHPSP